MPHNDRRLMEPQPKCSFEEVFRALSAMPGQKVSGLKTTGEKQVSFEAQARFSHSVGQFILLPHNNRIYPCCWGNTNNHMGKDGQRIGQYARPLDQWCQGLSRALSSRG